MLAFGRERNHARATPAGRAATAALPRAGHRDPIALVEALDTLPQASI
jgi:hypothetical protein